MDRIAEIKGRVEADEKHRIEFSEGEEYEHSDMVFLLDQLTAAHAEIERLETEAHEQDKAQHELFMAYCALREAQRRIPIEERLPDDKQRVLVYRNGFCSIAGFTVNGNSVDEYDLGGQMNIFYDFDGEYGYYSVDEITHWQPLPAAPEGE